MLEIFYNLRFFFVVEGKVDDGDEDDERKAELAVMMVIRRSDLCVWQQLSGVCIGEFNDP